MSSYWRIFAEEVPSDIGIELTEQQIDALTKALEGAHENYSLGTGQDVADRNWRASENRRLHENGAAAVLDYIEERVRVIDGGSARMFDAMDHRQKLAMHEIFEARKFLRQTISAGPPR
jgi:hypothetical protein